MWLGGRVRIGIILAPLLWLRPSASACSGLCSVACLSFVCVCCEAETSHHFSFFIFYFLGFSMMTCFVVRYLDMFLFCLSLIVDCNEGGGLSNF